MLGAAFCLASSSSRTWCKGLLLELMLYLVPGRRCHDVASARTTCLHPDGRAHGGKAQCTHHDFVAFFLLAILLVASTLTFLLAAFTF